MKSKISGDELIEVTQETTIALVQDDFSGYLDAHLDPAKALEACEMYHKLALYNLKHGNHERVYRNLSAIINLCFAAKVGLNKRMKDENSAGTV